MTQRHGAEHEVWFWRGWLQRSGASHAASRPLRRDLVPFVTGHGTRILNAGCGALNLIGDHCAADPALQVVACDLLADEYRALHQEFGIVPHTPIVREDMTGLSFADASFALVVCLNAIDHCADGPTALSELLRVCQPGGVVFLKHFHHEGKRLGYSGLHQSNVDMLPDGDCHIWNRDRSRCCLLSTYGEWQHQYDGRRITSIMRKA